MSLKCTECHSILAVGTSTRYCCDGVVCSSTCKNKRYLRIQNVDKTLSVPNKWDEWLDHKPIKRSQSMVINENIQITNMTLQLCYSDESLDSNNNIIDVSNEKNKTETSNTSLEKDSPFSPSKTNFSFPGPGTKKSVALY